MGARLPETRDGNKNQTWVEILQGVNSQAPFLKGARLESFQDYVAIKGKTPKYLAAIEVVEI